MKDRWSRTSYIVAFHTRDVANFPSLEQTRTTVNSRVAVITGTQTKNPRIHNLNHYTEIPLASFATHMTDIHKHKIPSETVCTF